MIVTFTIPGKPPSVNALYKPGVKGRRVLCPKAQAYKNKVMRIVRESGHKVSVDPMKEFLEVEYYFYLKDLITSTGKLSETVGDEDNFKKCLQDAAFKALKLNDAYVCKSTNYKLWGNEDKAIIVLKVSKLASIMEPF